MNQEFSDQVKGILFGQAIGDALGFGTEGMRKVEIKDFYPEGLTRYDQVLLRFDKFKAMGWVQGDWTDDTDQMLCILDSLVGLGHFNVRDIARRLHHWAISDGMGIGWSTYAIIHDPTFLLDPQKAALNYWHAQNCASAPNGGVMRTAVLGIWQYKAPEVVKHNAAEACRITHADPRYIGSAIAVSLAISALLQGETDIKQVVDIAQVAVSHFHPELDHWFDLASQPNVERLTLDPDSEKGMGYTLRTLAAGFWALQHAQSYQEGILAIIHEGGDADTNAAVAGALLGARFGYKNLPPQWIQGLVYHEQLMNKSNQLLACLT
ncbi:MAG: ADP-ribosylglycohydrolase family protein [Leptolyngbyaceae cyanobacterium]